MVFRTRPPQRLGTSRPCHKGLKRGGAEEKKCRVCGSVIDTPDIYGGRCENCYALAMTRGKIPANAMENAIEIQSRKIIERDSSEKQQRSIKNSDERRKSKPGGKKKES